MPAFPQTLLRAGGFNTLELLPFPLAKSAIAYVSINGRRYAGFRSFAAADEARVAWGRNWPAVAGQTLTVEAGN